MKKTIMLIALLAAVLCVHANDSNYWPHVSTMWPLDRGISLGKDAYVVGETDAAIAGSIAIGGGDAVAYVLDAAGAVQIGAGVNSEDNTFKVRGVTLASLDTVAATGETGVTVTEFGSVVRQLVLRASGVQLIIDGSSGAGWGTAQLGTLPEGRVIILGVTVESMAITADGGDLASGEGGDFGLGTTATADNTIAGTDVNLCPSTSLDPIQTGVDAALAAEAQFDGTSSAVEVHANCIIDDGDVAAQSTNTLACIATVTYINLGDY